MSVVQIVLLVAGALLVAFLLVLLVGVVLAKAKVGPFRFGDGDLETVRDAATHDADAVQSDDRFFRTDGPGSRGDGT
ncbi:hypothetical protein [Actinomadura parmotrematis]|uniref:Uncharacterized protein n=1 Tax=Actinomadura parmotrematis TaxID=2864039 RepID=A0ABS7FZP0_9ACTN|nr:hypothetical protein [Actinomadura parmotrematis]MBW8485916.1 hypothetical protein [Actinomadura parmotrematis]